ncbi:MAG: PEP-utilizing enzyme [Patescibacteria group bacterium]|nr:PEP-utilizing enzyme [Patescibacteria group bacterium]
MKPVINSFQPSLTEWFAALGEEEKSKRFREEDSHKTDRLEILNQEAGIPYEKFETFSGRDLADKTEKWRNVLENRGDELCAIRLVPLKPDLPKLRQRGVSIRGCYENWFLKQEIDPNDYKVELCSHCEMLLWSAIMVVTDKKIYGDMIRGMHSQLTHGETVEELIQFEFDFKDWKWSKHDSEAEAQVRRMIDLLYIPDQAAQENLKEKLHSEFSHDYLKDYFEFTVWPGDKLHMIDYNRLLPKYLSTDWSVNEGAADSSCELRGASAQPGSSRGIARIVTVENIESADIQPGEILVCDNTDVRFLPLMKKAGAIVTNRGGILSHAAIISRELKVPCVIGTKNATVTLRDGDEVEVDADKGIVKIINRA